jgi:hypothetical protein
VVAVLDHRGDPSNSGPLADSELWLPRKTNKGKLSQKERFGRPRAVVMSGPGAEFVRRAQGQRREWWGRRGTKNVELVRSYGID